VRSISSLSLQILRALEDHLLRHSGHHLLVRTRPEVALYVLNQKRLHLTQLEHRFRLTITISGEPPESGAGFGVERGEPVEEREERFAPPVQMIEDGEEPEPAEELEAEDEREEESGESRERGRRRRRRRRGNGDDRHERRYADAGESFGEAEPEGEAEEEPAGAEARRGEGDDEGADARRRRRGRRGGRRRGRGRENGDTPREGRPHERDADQELSAGESEATQLPAPGESDYDQEHPSAPEAGDAVEVGVTDGLDFEPPVPATAGLDATAERSPSQAPFEPSASQTASGPTVAPADSDPIPEASGAAEAPEPSAQPERVPEPAPDDRPKRSGWWNRKSFF
jgi:ribonuclease E